MPKKKDDIIDFLAKSRNSKYNNIEKELLNKLYIQCINTIKIFNDANKTECIFEIPIFIPNAPLYNIDEVALKLLGVLKKKGFVCNSISHNKLYIKWK